jgi:DNA-binding phage protein
VLGLYRALSERGNPRLSTLTAVLKAIGLKLTVEAAGRERKYDGGTAG